MEMLQRQDISCRDLFEELKRLKLYYIRSIEVCSMAVKCKVDDFVGRQKIPPQRHGEYKVISFCGHEESLCPLC